MREILFRGKRLDNGEWVVGDLVHNGKYCVVLPEKPESNAYLDYMVDPSTLGQYTGLQDKNGKRIFEGDIFRFPDEVWESYYTSCGTEYDSWEVENCGVVGFEEDIARYDFVQYKFDENSVRADLHENKELEFADFVRELEVIGNIHDNSELMEADHAD